MGNKKVCEYLMGLGSPKIKPNNEGEKVLRISELMRINDDHYPISIILLDGQNWYIKPSYAFEDDNNSFVSSEVFNSRAYNKIGVPSVVYHPAKIISFTDNIKMPKTSTKEEIEKRHTHPMVLSRDLKSLDNLQVCRAQEIPGFEKLFNKAVTISEVYDVEYALLNLKDERGLPVFSINCVKSIIDMYVVDMIFTQNDRHVGNYFFYKTDLDGPYEGVIAIDNETSDVADSYEFTDEEFNEQISGNLMVFNGVYSRKDTYINNLKALRHLYDKGSFRWDDSSDVVENFLACNIDKTIVEAEESTEFTLNERYKNRVKTLLENAQSVLGDN